MSINRRITLCFVAAISLLLCQCGEDEGGGGGATGGTTVTGTGGTAAGGIGGSGADGGNGTGATGGTGGTGGSPACQQLPPTFADGKSPTSTLYVDGNASSGGDGSTANPFDTLAAAQGAVTPGTEIIVRNEVVNDAQLTFVGTDQAPIWIRGDTGAKLRGGSAPALRLVNTSYLVVEDLELYESPNHVLHFDHSDYLVFRRLHVHRAVTACLKGSQTTHLYVEDCDFHGAAELPGGNPLSTQVFDLVGVNEGHVVRSEFHDGDNVMVMLKGGTSDLLFAFNEIYDQHDTGQSALHVGQATGPQYFQPSDAAYEGIRIVAYANFIHDVSGPFFAFQGCQDCAGVHNTMSGSDGGQLVRYLPGAAGIDSGQTTSINEGCRFTGNIVVGGRTDGASLNADAQNVGTGNGLDHNIWLKPPPLNWWSPLDQETATSTYDQDPEVGTDGTPANATLVQQAGPTDLAGIAFSSYFTQDLHGTCVTSPMDIGAIEVP